MRRVITFVDGFNLYHSINTLVARNGSSSCYKWLNLTNLSTQFLNKTEDLKEVHYFSAYAKWDQGKMDRHTVYINLLKATGVKVILGSFLKKTKRSRVPCQATCSQGKKNGLCNKSFVTYEEKLTDVNIAIDMLKACINDECDSVFLISGDNDFVPALQAIKTLKPAVEISVLFPPGARTKHLEKVCVGNNFRHMRIKEQHLKKALFPKVFSVAGSTFSCPSSWV